jgi:hypothetical protein
MIVWLLTIAFVFVAPQAPGVRAADSTDVQLSAAVRESPRLIGAPVQLVIVARWRIGGTILEPAFGDRVGGFEVVEARAGAVVKDGAAFAQTWTVDVVTFDSGHVTVPGLDFLVRRSGASATEHAATTPVELDIASVLIKPGDDIRPIKAALGLRWSRVEIALLVATASVTLAALLMVVQRLRQSRPSRKPVVAYRPSVALAALERALPTTSAGVPDFYARASDVVRKHLHETRGIPAPFLASPEIIRSLARQSAHAGRSPNIAPLLATIDRVKFGGLVPPVSAARELLRDVIKVLRATMDGSSP